MENESLFLRSFFNETIYRGPNVPSVLKGSDISPETIKQEKFHISGNTQADVLLILFYSGQDEIPSSQKEFLTMMLKAVGLSWPQVAWVNLDFYSETTWHEIIQEFGGTRVVIFQSEGNMIPEVTEGKITVADGRKILGTAPVVELEENKNRKMLLWKGLQELFNI